jgi:hypothetical protein
MRVFKSAPFVDDSDPDIAGTIALIDTNIEEDFGVTEWSTSAVVTGDIRYVEATHKRYEAVSDHSDRFPPDHLGTDWIELGATNLFRAFDLTTQSQTLADATDLQFTFQCNTLVTALAFFNLSGSHLRITVSPPGAGDWDDDEPTDDDDFEPQTDFVEYEFELIDTTPLIDWFEYFFTETETLTQVFVWPVPGFPGATIDVEIVGAPRAAVGEIAAGQLISLGTTVTNGRLSFEDFSRVESDFDGGLTVIRRGAADITEFPFSFPGFDAPRVRSVVKDLRATPAVFMMSEEGDQLGFFTYGFVRTFNATATDRNAYFASLEVRSLL